MKPKTAVSLLSTLAFAGFLTCAIIVKTYEPESGFGVVVALFGAVFFAIGGLFGTIFVLLRIRGEVAEDEEARRIVLFASVREGAILGVLACALILLSHLGAFVWWTALLLTAFFLSIELIFLTRTRSFHSDK